MGRLDTDKFSADVRLRALTLAHDTEQRCIDTEADIYVILLLQETKYDVLEKLESLEDEGDSPYYADDHGIATSEEAMAAAGLNIIGPDGEDEG